MQDKNKENVYVKDHNNISGNNKKKHVLSMMSLMLYLVIAPSLVLDASEGGFL